MWFLVVHILITFQPKKEYQLDSIFEPLEQTNTHFNITQLVQLNMLIKYVLT